MPNHSIRPIFCIELGYFFFAVDVLLVVFSLTIPLLLAIISLLY